MFTLNTLIRLSSNRMNTDFELRSLREFVVERKEDLESASKVVDQVLENAQANVNWMQMNYKTIIAWLTSAVNNTQRNSRLS
ncbi:hypothetical protein LSTR_LSTR014684 [Laodelphax striatellus]|uniref:Uncharacterized protein n=1 Tax=Laodelphax striatellus TaxID=195883 RepID=A0A482XN90_LAOST|nr:hypothetical protein LSTR_LSTR014684 [Laodelphax striatellus]